MNADDGRERPIANLGSGQVEPQMLLVRIRVLDIGLKNDAVRDLQFGRLLPDDAGG